jgi:hypothetical protein
MAQVCPAGCSLDVNKSVIPKWTQTQKTDDSRRTKGNEDK